MIKRISAFIIAVALLGSVASCSMPDTIFAEDGLSKQTDEQSEETADIFDFSFDLSGQHYELPLNYSAFSARGWKLSEAAEAPEETVAAEEKVYTLDSVLEPGEYSGYLPAEKNGYVVGLKFCNQEKKAAGLAACTVVGIRLRDDASQLPEFQITDGVTIGSHYDELAAAYGRPSYVRSCLKTTGELVAVNDVIFTETDDDTVQTLYYALSEHSGFSFEFGEYGDSSNAVVSITIDNDTPAEKPYDYSKDLKRMSDSIKLYKGPSLLGKTFSEVAFKYEGNLYTLPIPVKKLLDDGWTFARGSSIRVPIGTTAEGVILRKGNNAVNVLVHNYDMKYARTPVNCYAVSLSACVEGPNVSLLMPKGITLGSEEGELVQAFGKEYAKTHAVDEEAEESAADTKNANAKADDNKTAADVETTERFDIPDLAGCYIEKTVYEDETVYSYVMPDDVPYVTLPVSITDIGDTGSDLLGDVRKHIDVYVSNVNHAVVKVYMQNCPEYIVDENEIIEQQMEAARKLEEEAAKKAQEEKEAGGN